MLFLGFRPFTAPNFKLTVKRTHRINENEHKDCILWTVQVTKAPGNRDDGQVNQVRIERSPANLSYKTNAEEPRHKALPRQ